jgi:large subunit ribosomal protein L30e
MAKKKIEVEVVEIKKVLEKDTVIFGKEQVLKKLRAGVVERIFISANCPAEKDIKRYAGLSHVDVVKVDKSNQELGTICRKPFQVSVLAVVKSG